VNALANPQVGKYLNATCVASYQKVGTFRLAGGQKQGGNVASYFCTPGGRVLHAVAGPVDAATLLREARWAVEAHKFARLEGGGDAALREQFGRAHADRLRQQYGLDLHGGSGAGRALDLQGKVHLLLTAAPLPRLESVYKTVFEKVLGEAVSTAPVVQGGG
jgi:hypothetical protein